MQILRSFSAWNLILMGGLLIGIGACMNDNGIQNYDNRDHTPTYSTNTANDDNGAEPMPNAGNQNFGSRH